MVTNSLNTYFKSTRSLSYSYIVCLPLLFLYEILITISQPDTEAMVRLGADIWIKSILALTGYDTLAITFTLVVALGAFVYFKERKNPVTLHGRYFLYLILESLVWGLLLAFLISGLVGWIFQMTPAPESLTRLQLFALSLGAGLYEELVFRVILVSGLVIAFGKLGFSRVWKHASAILLGAAIFSMVHYMGSLGDPFTFSSFTFRFLFGIALNALLVLRGFGVAVWTHSLYNVMVVLLR